MKTNLLIKHFIFSIYLLFFISCVNIQPENNQNSRQEYNDPIIDFFITTMTSYDENQQPFLQMYEINEREAFIELVRQILDNPDYVYSYIQNDLYYIAQIYNSFSMAEYSVRGGGIFEALNSSGVQTTFRNIETGQLLDIRTYHQRGRYSEIINFLLEAGYFIHTETFDRSQTILLKNYRVTYLPFYFTDPVVQTTINIFGYDLYYLGYRPSRDEFSSVINNYFRDIITSSETLLPWSYNFIENNTVLDDRVKSFMRMNNLTVSTTFDLNEFGGFTYIVNYSFDNHRTFNFISMDSEGYDPSSNR